MTTKQAIAIDGGAVYGPYTPGVRSGNSLWLSGQIAPEAGGLEAQVAGALAKIDALLEAGGSSKHDLVAVQVLLMDIEDFTAMNQVYAAWMEGVRVPPTRAAFQAAALPAGAAVEIVAHAVLDSA
ncbi:MAG TPA: RidA family protein [Candidatus Poseidoniaceae archaeon]|nr:MAG TPA: RidA family protein [Candidatus Poseidoniales archaeon]HIH53478.1 RidA family protein [Candidatus Poseidoniaceae archaeon]